MARKSEGSRLLAATGLDHATLAAQVGVSRAAVTQWMNGDRLPGQARRRILRELFGVPEGAWDESPRSKALGAAQATAAPSKLDAEGRLRAQLQRLDQIRSAAKSDVDMAPQTRLRLEATETRCIELLSKLTGEGQEISESRILRTPAWRRIVDAMVKAFRDHPEAAVEVEAALKEIGE